MHYDVIVVGGGPAGATAALNLAPTHRVAIIEAASEPRSRIGESIPGAVNRLLSDMALLGGFRADRHMPRQALESTWGDFAPDVRYAISDPDGSGWQIDRVRFDRQLRREAVERGARLFAPAKIADLKRSNSSWVVTVASPAGPTVLEAGIILDASGRGSSGTAVLPRTTRSQGRLTCFWVRSKNVLLQAGTVQIEAEPDGWWYAAPLPEGCTLVAFHTDADLPAARSVRTPLGLLDRLRQTKRLSRHLGHGLWDNTTFGICAADGIRREQVAGPGWAAVGDAAIAFDPISSQGIFNALYLGLAAAEASSRALALDDSALDGYAVEVEAIWERYALARAAFYSLERRWSDRPFWARRHR